MFLQRARTQKTSGTLLFRIESFSDSLERRRDFQTNSIDDQVATRERERRRRLFLVEIGIRASAGRPLFLFNFVVFGSEERERETNNRLKKRCAAFN